MLDEGSAGRPVDDSTCSPDQREQVLDGLASRGNALHVEMLRVVVAAEEANDHRADGCRNMTEWLTYRYRLPHAVASQWVRAARAFVEMPLLEAAYAAGQVSLDQVVQALRFAGHDDDAWLATVLPSLGFAEVEQMAKQRRRIHPRERDDARHTTHLRLRADRSGLGSRIAGFLPTEDAAIIARALDRRAEAMGPDAESGLWDPYEVRIAGGLRDLCAEDLAEHADASSAPDASVVVVHVPASTVGRDEPGPDGSATIGGEPIDNDALHRILCDTRIELHVEGPDGATVGIGRASRTPPRWLRRRVVGRDHGRCRWPGCGRAIRHLHHMQHWTRGGRTDAANLLGVCWHHHHLLHEGGWHATGNADTTVTFTGAAGRTLTSRPAPLAA